MTFDPTVPNAAQSPSLFPAQANTNFARLQTLIAGDHIFNDTAQANDGTHRQVTLTSRAPPGATPTGTQGQIYCRIISGLPQLFWWNNTSHQQITPPAIAPGGGPEIVAAVNFDGSTFVASCPIRTSYNVSSVTQIVIPPIGPVPPIGRGKYTINFAAPIADNNYIVLATGMRATNGGVCFGFVQGSTTYGISNQVSKVLIGFSNGSSSTDFTDVLMGNVVVYKI